jgi:hypothetical protein
MEITATYLRHRAEFYREKAARAKKAVDANRYRGFAELLNEQAARFEKLAEGDRISPPHPTLRPTAEKKDISFEGRRRIAAVADELKDLAEAVEHELPVEPW